jgi:hypothetical protein
MLRLSYQLLRKTWKICNGSSSTRTPIHILDDDSLLNIFHFYRPAPSLSSENEGDVIKILGGGNWNGERWWYSLVRVCRRWRYLVFESASLLGLSLLCTYGTPVADVLAHFPPFPLVLDYHDPKADLTADDELGILLALWNCDRVRCIRLMQPVPVIRRIFMILQGEFPNLEYLIIERHPSERRMFLVMIPKTFRAPRLRYLVAMGLHIPIGSPSFATTGNPVCLSLTFRTRSSVNILLRELSVVPQRETPGNTLNTYLPSDDIDGQLLQRAIMRHVTPYLRYFGFQGLNTYFETPLPLVTIVLERLQLDLIPRRPQFMSTVEIPRLKTVILTFNDDYSRVHACPPQYILLTLSMALGSSHLDLQVTHTAQVFHMLRAVFSPAEHLILKYHRCPILSTGWNNEANRAQWHELLRIFDNVKTLSINYGIVGQLSRSLQPDEGESPTDLLPELQKLIYPALELSDDAFAPFVEARRKVGRLITVIRVGNHVLQ